MPFRIATFLSLVVALLLPSIRGLAESTVADTGDRESLTNLVPAYLLEVPGSVRDVLVADTAESSLWRFDVDNGQMVGSDQRYMSIGINGVGKRRAWDKRTPLGIYFITDRIDTSRMHNKYGAAAFPLD